jgi:hypothetical protein
VRRAILIAIVLAPVGAVAGFIVVGWCFPRDGVEGFDTELASIFGTAVGTVLLSLATGTLAWVTTRDVSATEKLAQTAAAEQRDRFRPMVIGRVMRVSAIDVDVAVENVGPGPALGVLVSCTSPFASVDLQVFSSLAAGERKYITLENKPHEKPSPAHGPKLHPNPEPQPFELRGNYTVEGHYFDWRGQRARIFDWVHHGTPSVDKIESS